jgi:hypothetical protein
MAQSPPHPSAAPFFPPQHGRSQTCRTRPRAHDTRRPGRRASICGGDSCVHGRQTVSARQAPVCNAAAGVCSARRQLRYARLDRPCPAGAPAAVGALVCRGRWLLADTWAILLPAAIDHPRQPHWRETLHDMAQPGGPSLRTVCSFRALVSMTEVCPRARAMKTRSARSCSRSTGRHCSPPLPRHGRTGSIGRPPSPGGSGALSAGWGRIKARRQFPATSGRSDHAAGPRLSRSRRSTQRPPGPLTGRGVVAVRFTQPCGETRAAARL